jgi:GDP-L-fucose synthase
VKPLQKTDRIYIAGHRGLVGQAITASLINRGYPNLLTCDRESLDLRDQAAIKNFLTAEKPDVVFIAAARVGGILANDRQGADFIHDNLAIGSHLIWSSHLAGVRRLIFLSSSCAYPRECPQPIKESALLGGPLESTNRPYAVAKIAGMELVHSLRRQYQRDYFSVMPTNLYGPGDNFHPQDSHVIPGIIRKVLDAKRLGAPEITIWGTGKPRREFLFAGDCGDAIVHLCENIQPDFFESEAYPAKGYSHINIGTGKDIAIRELAELIACLADYRGALKFNDAMPDGTPVKRLDTEVLLKTGWKYKTSLESGIKKTLEWLDRNPLT